MTKSETKSTSLARRCCRTLRTHQLPTPAPRASKSSPCGASSDTRLDHLLSRALDGRRRTHAVPLGRDRQAIPGCLRRDRDRLGGPLPSTIVEKVGAQVGRLQHTTTIYLHPAIAQLGQKLADHMPQESGLSVSYFTNSGSEANEIAISLPRVHRQRRRPHLRNGYHGGTGDHG